MHFPARPRTMQKYVSPVEQNISDSSLSRMLRQFKFQDELCFQVCRYRQGIEFPCFQCGVLVLQRVALQLAGSLGMILYHSRTPFLTACSCAQKLAQLSCCASGVHHREVTADTIEAHFGVCKFKRETVRSSARTSCRGCWTNTIFFRRSYVNRVIGVFLTNTCNVHDDTLIKCPILHVCCYCVPMRHSNVDECEILV